MIQAARHQRTDGGEVTLLVGYDPATAPAGGLPLTERLLGRRRAGRAAPAPEPPFAGWQRYREVELIGEGGMGRVFRAHDPALDRPVALKFPRHGEPGHGGRTLYEARLQARVEGAHVPKVYEVGELAGHAYFAMQLVAGPSLKEARARLPYDEKLTVALRLCDALEEVHARGLVHRDVNPRNVLLAPRPDGSWWPYLVDFGIAHELPHPSRPVDPEVVGTAPYMAPEQALGKIFQIDRRTDVYSLGATLYELFSGHRPFAAESSEKMILRTLQEEPVPLSAVAPSLPAALGETIDRCLRKEPAERFPSARAAAAALAECRRSS
jgi:serine/threonine-protein kinase